VNNVLKNKFKKGKGFLAGAKDNYDKAPYRQYARTPEMFAYGEKSSFRTPDTLEEQLKSPKGMKR